MMCFHLLFGGITSSAMGEGAQERGVLAMGARNRRRTELDACQIHQRRR